jgi:hypothetical protein
VIVMVGESVGLGVGLGLGGFVDGGWAVGEGDTVGGGRGHHSRDAASTVVYEARS